MVNDKPIVEPTGPTADQIEDVEDLIFPPPDPTGTGGMPQLGHTAMLAVSLAMSLKNARLAAGLQLGEAAARARLDKAVASKLENGKIRNPKLDTLMRYAVACGYEIEARVVPVDPQFLGDGVADDGEGSATQ